MLVIALCMACFSKAKINKIFGPPTSNALAPALVRGQIPGRRWL